MSENAVYADDYGAYVFVRSGVELDLGRARPGQPMTFTGVTGIRAPLCRGGFLTGSRLVWPPKEMPLDQRLLWLATALNAMPYRDRRDYLDSRYRSRLANRVRRYG